MRLPAAVWGMPFAERIHTKQKQHTTHELFCELHAP